MEYLKMPYEEKRELWEYAPPAAKALTVAEAVFGNLKVDAALFLVFTLLFVH